MSDSAREGLIAELCDAYPKAAILDPDDGSIRILIEYHLNAKYEDIPLAEDFGLEIQLAKDYPNTIPLVRETTRIIPDDYEHCFCGKWFCLGVSYELAKGLAANPSLLAFLDGPVQSFLYTALFHTLYGRYPYGDRPHGAAGVLQAYSEYFGTDNDCSTINLMLEAAQGQYRGKAPCPCGSRKATRSCHGEAIRQLMQESIRKAVCTDLMPVLDYIELKRKQLTALRLVDAKSVLLTGINR